MADFADGKAKSAFRTIGEVSEALNIKPHVLRYWEQQFSLLKPMKRSGGRRLYRPSDIEMVEAINRLVNEEGYTLKGAEAVLRSEGVAGSERRKSERREFDRRDGEEFSPGAPQPEASQPQTAAQSGDGSAIAESIGKLKEIRARLARAIEA
ncbi:transcriptional regulator [Erythrobacter longus]|uniref:Transcriptional regulator n=1 Tax=Erythrobacter longus TaxID=1044 RepID=A0A074MGG0_ERYLO|nr:MerR family transcriptional regulator [Erythrobacter longus]KEO91910.1 transcriptional regulator [Erythrobacter longus]